MIWLLLKPWGLLHWIPANLIMSFFFFFLLISTTLQTFQYISIEVIEVVPTFKQQTFFLVM